ncbi:hypothetical protein ACEUZ9_004338 [Paracoccus litorisediminis]|uniref:Uncharacterized protein n=1 Tax=Paracoccus litorisediminis TaxID=2006130 RepID=A0A844HU46_9RHOB|nr:hypothetical protein [Paracoccus litorisediminis]MTH61042.1 hypothetical protein [Paracoccus litorisediminis]
MADLDSGHIFLTTLAPIKGAKDDPDIGVSYEQRVRIALAELPTALQSPATQNIGLNSPFARNRRTHLARMFVLSDVVYNGRNAQNPVVATAKGINPVDPLPIDELNAPYLVFCADIDAVTSDGAPLPHNLTAKQQKEVRASYARELWNTMGPELKDIYCNCVGFDDVTTADDFATYLDRCHVETTMPFHDYYLELPKFNDLPVKSLLAAVGVPAAITVLMLLLRILGCLNLPMLGFSTLWTAVVAGLVTAGAAMFSLGYALRNGAKPLAPGKYDDLPSVLKALYTQQTFSDFIVAHQGADPDKLYADFAAFLTEHKPQDKHAPTQTPGVISIREQGGISI